MTRPEAELLVAAEATGAFVRPQPEPGSPAMEALILSLVDEGFDRVDAVGMAVDTMLLPRSRNGA